MSELEKEEHVGTNLKIINTNILLIIKLLKENKSDLESSNTKIPIELEEQGYEILEKKITKEYSQLFPDLLLRKRIEIEYERISEQLEI